jgi:ABC-type branched-subunit amino acid transport system substrate-binding protein
MRGVGATGGRRVLAVAALLGSLAVTHAALALEPAQARGKRIYTEGTSASGGDVQAVIGDEGVTLPASAVPCASCHGPDGLGRDEGGLVPPNIRWSELVKGYGHVHDNGRRHPAFDAASVAHLLRTGLDPAENRLDSSMPLYRMSDEDMADLIAYLRHLEHDRDPGVDTDRVQVGTLLPLRGPAGATGQAMAQVLYAHFQDVNARGGVFGRRIDLLTVPFGASREASLDNLRAAFEAEGIFALVGAYTVGLDDALLAMLREDEVPLVGPFTLDPGDGLADAATFYMYPGFEEQARTLVDQALTEATARSAPVVIAGPEGARVDRLVAAVRDQMDGRTVANPVVARYPPGAMQGAALAAQVRATGSDAVFFFGARSDLDVLLDALAASHQQGPRVYLLSAFVGRPLFEAPEAFHHRLFLAYPTFSSDLSAVGKAEYMDLAKRHALPPDHVQAQVAALAAAKLFVEGLRRAGRDLSREKLVAGLEALYAFDTGLTPPLTYGPNRRIGARGAHVVAVDLMKKTYAPVGGWHELR